MKKITLFRIFFSAILLMGAISAFSQDFTFVIIPDPQNESEYNTDMLTSQMNWMVTNKVTNNIVFVTCVGDLVNTCTSTTQYSNADAAFDILDAGNITYSVSPGNHDMGMGTLWANYFGTSRFAGKSWYGGSYNNFNTWSFFSASCNDFIVINLQYNPTTAILNWADNLLKTNPNRRGIVVQHNILNVNNSWITEGQTTYNALRGNPNFFLMLCGHMHTSTDGAAYVAGSGTDGHTIHVVQADYQDMSYGNGYLRILRFSPGNDMIYMATYSPYIDKSITTSPDQMNLAYDLNTTSVTWDGSSNTDWNTAANWTPANVPASCTDVTIPGSGVLNFPVVSSTNAACNNLTVNSLGKLTVNAGSQLTVSGQTTIHSNSTSESGSLIINGTLSPNHVTYNRQMRTDDWHYFSSPVSGLLKSAFKSDNSGVSKIWVWNEDKWYGTVNSCWYDSTDAGYFKMGRGYNLEQNGSEGMFSFTGKLVTSTSFTATSPYSAYSSGYNNFVSGRNPATGGVYGGGGWNLLGNPFTSAMNASAFISTNSGSFDPSYQAIYVYAGDEGDYGNYYYIASSVPGFEGNGTFRDNNNIPYSHIQVGQGFFVLALQNNVTFNFTSAMQAHNTSVPLKSAETPWPGFQLKVTDGTSENSTLMVYNDEMNAGLDPGYDVGQFSSGADIEIYTMLVKDNGNNFARQALPLDNFNQNIIPVGLNALNGGNVTFSADVVPLENRKFVLEDRQKNIFTNLGENTYSVTLPENTSGTGRFFIHAAQTSLSLNPSLRGGQGGAGMALRIWTSMNRIHIEGAVSNKATGAVYDMLGRKVFETRLQNANLNALVLPSTERGVYMVKVTDGAMVTTKKVVL